MGLLSKKTQIYLSPELDRAVASRAKIVRRSKAYVIREAVEQFLKTPVRGPTPKDDPVWGIVGIADSSLTDASDRHDDYIYDEETGKKDKKL